MKHRLAAALPLLFGGGLLIGTLDLLFAFGFWAPRGATFTGILHSISAGWYGAQSREMGLHSAVVGALSHYLIASTFVLAYWAAAGRWPALLRHPWICGSAYGVALYLAMNFIVLPLSAAGEPSFADTAWVASSVVAHALIGVLCAWFARKARRY